MPQPYLSAMPRDVTTAIGMLPPAYRSALHLQLGGATSADIGAVLHLDPAAVPPLLAVAHAKLRELLLASEPFDDPEPPEPDRGGHAGAI